MVTADRLADDPAGRPSRPRLVIITPVFNEEDGLPAYAEEVRRVLLDGSGCDARVLFVDDGSRDGSWAVIKRLHAEDPRFQGVRLSRNFGAHIALCAGFDLAEADVYCTLAADLQDPPEVVLRFLDAWSKGASIVWGKRASREDASWRVFASDLFFRLLQRYAMPRGSKFTTGSFLLADRAVVENLRRFREHNRITFALVAWTGFDQEVVAYERRRRLAGKSGWTVRRMIRAMYDAFIGFSSVPIRLMTHLGLGVAVCNLGFLVYLVAQWLTGTPMPGWTSFMFVMTFFFGIQFLLMGILGEYLSRIYQEAMRRPLYFVSGAVGMDGVPTPAPVRDTYGGPQ
ncbi:MAG: glycosyltransferase family 2 protein [Solidesulfovibrio sp.]|uniref:glycosyltransferase family 2 protein n=1 Tax=Solidesulfovibrio sp. TaxID=2910990 RepID=UPI002B1FC147|nr:glycosyltransferase family 2 protein [Solidesulfovibrio sp.]MEA4855048.1 glycosyltransferase family 2 protein [Solidesulfovibrio sp.]